MTAKVQKWGNSLALRIPAVMAREISVEGDAVEIEVRRDALVIRAAKPRYELAAGLVKGINRENVHQETNWGAASGGEAW